MPQMEKHKLTENEVCEVTLKRLHTLGNQRFGSSPYSEHYSRWIADVEMILGEFEVYPTLEIDDRFKSETAQTFATVKIQLEERRKKEAAVDQEIEKMTYIKKQLEQIDTKYATAVAAVKARKNAETKRLQVSIKQLREEQERVIKLKTGFWHGISKKEREKKEFSVAQQLNECQTELELLILNTKVELKLLREKVERQREPVIEQIKRFKRRIKEFETDGSLEERWFASQALADAVNTFLQRRATGPTKSKSEF